MSSAGSRRPNRSELVRTVSEALGTSHGPTASRHLSRSERRGTHDFLYRVPLLYLTITAVVGLSFAARSKARAYNPGVSIGVPKTLTRLAVFPRCPSRVLRMRIATIHEFTQPHKSSFPFAVHLLRKQIKRDRIFVFIFYFIYF